MTAENQHHPLATRPDPFAITTFDQVKEMAGFLAKASMYGLKEEAQFISLMMMAHEENITLGRLMQRVHVFPDGKLSNRADWLQAEFEEKAGKIIWHTRTDEVCVATFIRGQEITDEQRDRAEKRFELLIELDAAMWLDPRNAEKERKLQVAIGKLAREGEETVLRSAADAWSKGLSKDKTGNALKTNWFTSPRSMLQWRCVSEGIKVVCPRILSGMPTDVEYNDVRILQEQEKRRVTTEPKPGDEQAILGIIAGYDEELSDPKLPDSRRKLLLGLRQDLKIKLEEMGLSAPTEAPNPEPMVGNQPAKAVETVVLPPETQASPKPTRQRKPAAQPAEATTASTAQTSTEQDASTPWQDFKSHVGAAGSTFLGNTLGNVFAKATNHARLEAIVKAFADMLSGSAIPKDVLLWKKVEEAKAAWQLPTPQEPASAAGTAGSTETAAKPAEATKAPAQPTSWRDYTIAIKSESLQGKKLGDLDLDTMKRIQTEYFDKIDPKRYTLEQKKFKAHLTSALAELLPPAASSEPAAESKLSDYGRQLAAQIDRHGLDRLTFLRVCRENGYISANATKMTDITDEEITVLTTEWEQVATEVQEAQKAAQ